MNSAVIPGRNDLGKHDLLFLVWNDGKRVILLDEDGATDVADLPFYALGAQCSAVALGALHMGATAEQAVEIAIRVGPWAAGPVQSVRLPAGRSRRWRCSDLEVELNGPGAPSPRSLVIISSGSRSRRPTNGRRKSGLSVLDEPSVQAMRAIQPGEWPRPTQSVEPEKPEDWRQRRGLR